MSTVLRERVRASASILVLAVTPALALPARAQEAAPETALDAITVTADRIPSTVFDSPSTVTVTESREIDRRSINSPRDLAREEPGVSVGNQPARGGATNYVIRGIGDNRVRVQVDGIKVPDFPETNIGAGTYTRDFVDFDQLKQVEIVRGPASALYGSDAIGGVVSYVTKDPADYLAPGKDWFLSGKAGFDSADRSLVATQAGAFRIGPWEAMVLHTRRQGGEVRPNGRAVPNPQDFLTHSALAKLVHRSPDWGVFRLTAEYLRKTVETRLLTEEILSGGARGQPFTRVFSSEGDDATSRPRVSLDWTLPVSSVLADTVQSRLFWTRVDRQELTAQLRGTRAGAAPASPTVSRLSDFRFSQEIRGGEVQATALRELWGFRHLLTYGVSADVTTTSRPRDRVDTTLATGASTRVISAETYPNKNFPDTDTLQASAYVQDVATLGPLRIIPALRLDYYRLTPNPDAAFANSNVRGFAVEEQTHTALSPKLGATYDLTDTLRAFGQYARGFRAPPYDNANFGFSNPVFRYEILPNGGLRPETSDGFEAGLRGRFSDGSSFQVSGFYNLYRDFLETRVVGTTAAGLTQYQYQNLRRVRIYGVEAKGDWRFAPGWSLFGNLAYAEGEDEETGRPLDSVDPLTFLAGLRYQDQGGWGGEVRVRGAARKSRVSDPSLFVRPEAYAALDAFLFYDVSESLSVNVGVYNLLDARYFNPQDVVGLQVTNPNRELFRAPGRTVAVNATLRW